MFGNPFDMHGSLFDEFRRLETELDDMFGRGPWRGSIRSVAHGTYPPINIGATPERVDIYVFAAGLDPQALDISIQQNLLTIAGKRELPPTEEGRNYYRQERFSGAFRRVVTLPDDVDPERVEARYDNGVLQLQVQRRAAARPRQITVK